jgi:hypothetical protein
MENLRLFFTLILDWLKYTFDLPAWASLLFLLVIIEFIFLTIRFIS